VATLLENETIEIVAVVVTVDGGRALRTTASGPLADAAAIGVRAARQLMAEGAGDILAEARQVHAAVEGIQP
jgi:porphobilinogen deaminase